jgi:voltage-gated potassium channel
MIAFFVTIGQFFRAIWRGLKDREFRALLILVVVILLVGTLFYMRWEHWTWIDALFFCVVTLTTIGYGDKIPTTPGTKLFTIFYIFLGIGILLAFIERVARNALLKPKQEKKEDKGIAPPKSA